ncbi:MAG: VOC family protein, partial [Acidobacteria bacterium]|nr:VOC family protein [Acidobacteriota bacterium]
GEKVRVAMLPAGRTRIELVEPLSDDSTVARFIERRGEGIHHICFEVADLDAAMKRFGNAGLIPAGAPGRPGAKGSRIAFIHPKGTGGILIELREAAGASRRQARQDRTESSGRRRGGGTSPPRGAPEAR